MAQRCPSRPWSINSTPRFKRWAARGGIHRASSRAWSGPEGCTEFTATADRPYRPIGCHKHERIRRRSPRGEQGHAPLSWERVKIHVAPCELFLHFPFLAANDVRDSDHADDNAGKRDGPKRAADAMNRIAKHKGAYSEHKRPNDASGRIEEQKWRPSIFVRAREKRRENAQEGKKTAEKDDLPAVLFEEVLAEDEPFFREVNKFAVAQKEFRTPCPADPETDIVAGDRARRRAGDDKGQAKLTGGTGINGGQNQNGFSRQGNARTLQHDDEEDEPIAVLRDERLNMG